MDQKRTTYHQWIKIITAVDFINITAIDEKEMMARKISVDTDCELFLSYEDSSYLRQEKG